VISQTKQAVERKHMISDADNVLSDLTKWREDRRKRELQRKEEMQNSTPKHITVKVTSSQILSGDFLEEDPEIALAQKQYEESMRQFRNIGKIESMHIKKDLSSDI